MTRPFPGARGRARPSSLRRRLFVVLALTALACVGTTAVVTLVLGARTARATRLNGLRSQADATVSAIDASGRPARLQLRVLVAGAPGTPVRAAAPKRARAVRAELAGHRPGDGSIDVMGRELLYVLRTTTTGPVVLIRPTARQAGDARGLGSIVALSALAGLLLAAALAAFSARRIVRPITALTAATGPVAAGTVPLPIAEDGPSELAELAGAFNTMSGELQAARDTERRFLMTVSHELRTPLTNIRGYSDALADGHVEGPEAAGILQAEARRLERLVGDLLDLASVGSSTFAVADDRVDLGDVARSAVERHAAVAREAGVALTNEIEAGAQAQGDAGRLLQAVSNLVENAVRVTPPGGRVVIDAAPARLCVTDTGPGLSAEDRERAFERFHLHHRGGAPVGSSGLGLALVAELTAAMGGRVAAEPGPGGGTRFVLDLRGPGTADRLSPSSPPSAADRP